MVTKKFYIKGGIMYKLGKDIIVGAEKNYYCEYCGYKEEYCKCQIVLAKGIEIGKKFEKLRKK